MTLTFNQQTIYKDDHSLATSILFIKEHNHNLNNSDLDRVTLIILEKYYYYASGIPFHIVLDIHFEQLHMDIVTVNSEVFAIFY